MSTTPCRAVPEIRATIEAAQAPTVRLAVETVAFFARLKRSRCAFLKEAKINDDTTGIRLNLKVWTLPGEGVVVALYRAEVPAERLLEEGIALADRERAVVQPVLVKQGLSTLYQAGSRLADVLEPILVGIARESEGI